MNKGLIKYFLVLFLIIIIHVLNADTFSQITRSFIQDVVSEIADFTNRLNTNQY